MPVANAIITLVTLMTAVVGGWTWSLLSGLPWYITIPGAVVALLVLVLMAEIARVMPKLIAFRGIRLARTARTLTHDYVPGFVLPVGFWRLLMNRAEYALVYLVCEGGASPWRRTLRATRGQRLYETFGWDAEAICRYAMQQDDPQAVIIEAKELAQEYPLAEVIRYAGHPVGAKRGFEFLRSGIPYEFGELLV